MVATVKRRNNKVRLTVDDEGKGFDPDTIQNLDNELQGIGLVSIQEWVASMDGRMTIESAKERDVAWFWMFRLITVLSCKLLPFKIIEQC